METTALTVASNGEALKKYPKGQDSHPSCSVIHILHVSKPVVGLMGYILTSNMFVFMEPILFHGHNAPDQVSTFIFFWSHSTMAARSCRSIIVEEMLSLPGQSGTRLCVCLHQSKTMLLNYVPATADPGHKPGYSIRFFSLHAQIQKQSPFLPYTIPYPPPQKKKTASPRPVLFGEVFPLCFQFFIKTRMRWIEAIW